MITKDLLTTEPLKQFILNAKKFNHSLDSLVIAYSDQVDPQVVQELETYLTVHLIKIRQDVSLNENLKELGLSKKDRCCLIGDIDDPSDGRAPYGLNRNHVIIKAMLESMDVLIFIDTDVYPEVIIKKEDLIIGDKLSIRPSGLKDVWIQEVDFLGYHLKGLEAENIMITTSDYSGYYIIPPMKFKGMDDLYYGLKKETAYDYMMDSLHHHCLSTDHGKYRESFLTNKVLGGNVAIKLNLFKKIVPFYSSAYYVEDEKYLTRGEDTVLALQISEEEKIDFLDIDLKIFHNTFSNFPEVPNIKNDKKIKDRFFYASMGWIGRNPFLNDLQGLDIECVYQNEHEHLKKGSKAIANYLQDPRFLILANAHEWAYDHLKVMKEEYQCFRKSWFEFIRRLT
jgi:hypothetical protein